MWYENNFFSCLSFIFENFYYISGIALFLLGIKQIVLSKKQSNLKNLRDAITLSVNQCEIFAGEITSLGSRISDFHRDRKINLENIIESLPEESRSPFSIPNEKSEEVLIEMIKEDLLNDYLTLANRLEAFSTYFVSGVAHSETAYKTLGRAYCKYVILVSPILSYLDSEQNSYLHTKSLYHSWKNKLDVEKAQTALLNASSKDKQHFETIGTR